LASFPYIVSSRQANDTTMSVQLQAIKLNHDSSSATHGALNVRRDASNFVSVPEWTRGSSTKPEDAPAAYAMKPTKGNTLKIEAKFNNTAEEQKEVEIRALDPAIEPKDPQGCAGVLLRLLRFILRGLFGNVLGEVKARTVILPASGQTGFKTFELKNSRLWSAGVGIRTTRWRWQYRELPGGQWTDFDTSSHRIYSVLEVPNAPWQQQPHNSSNTQLPWIEALERSAAWAFLTKNRVKAATEVTKGIYHDLGGSRIEYDCPHGGFTQYLYGSKYDLTGFLERANGGPGNGKWVNCTDCANSVVTFANLLGCDLAASQMNDPDAEGGFGLNPIKSIGSAQWRPACGWASFNYHEVAWEANHDENSDVYDACLAVDGDPNPTSAPHTFLLPTDMQFGQPGNDYRSRIATPGDQADCYPNQNPKRRAVA
jgi:hypothetical protein